MSAIHALALEALLSVLAPPRCAACDAPVRLLHALCPLCAAAAVPAVPLLGAPGIAAFVYGGPIARAVTRLKYERRPDLARPLADLLWRAHERSPAARIREGPLVVPVPLHPARLAERGFNQAALLASRLARLAGLPWDPLALRRSRETRVQAELGRAGRADNVRGVFTARHASRLTGRAVLLVDDVRTTGATLDACARAAADAGARAVTWAVVAQAP